MLSSPCSLNGVSAMHDYNVLTVVESLFSSKSGTSSSVHIKNPGIVRLKLIRMTKLGKDNLQIISDFDWTMSKFLHNGELNPTCHGIFEQDPEMTTEARSKLRMLRQTYVPVEFDQNIPNSSKIPFMLEWWDLSHQVIVGSNVHKDSLLTTVQNCNLRLRDRVPEFMSILHMHNIPMLVFSAGLGDVIEMILERYDMRYDNVKVISNFMNFDKNGLLVCFRSPCIHTFNKSFASVALSDDLHKNVSKRRCVILMGDSSYDPHMADGLVEEGLDSDTDEATSPTILRIGFLNSKETRELRKFVQET
uniref:5'-nucleotidase n=1 Tax=Mesocestoides corti TaxID=53468 RepID=A0A5K3EKH6_MESCO